MRLFLLWVQHHASIISEAQHNNIASHSPFPSDFIFFVAPLFLYFKTNIISSCVLQDYDREGHYKPAHPEPHHPQPHYKPGPKPTPPYQPYQPYQPGPRHPTPDYKPTGPHYPRPNYKPGPEPHSPYIHHDSPSHQPPHAPYSHPNPAHGPRREGPLPPYDEGHHIPSHHGPHPQGPHGYAYGPREDDSYLSRGPSQPWGEYPKVVPHEEQQQQQQAPSMLGLVQDGQVSRVCWGGGVHWVLGEGRECEV